MPAVFTVNELADTHAANLSTGTDASGHVSLRSAIEAANSLGGDQTIQFDPGMFATTRTIVLRLGWLALRDASGTVTIQGPAAGVGISGNDASEVLRVSVGSTVELNDVTVTAGRVTGEDTDVGGGIYNNGNLTITDSTIANSVALTPYPIELFGGDGGGVYNNSSLTMVDCIITGNGAGSDGAGIDNSTNGTLNLTDCTLSRNHIIADNYGVSGSGGGILNAGTATFDECTISGNTAAIGGGISNGGTLTLQDSVISGNATIANFYNQGGNWGAGGGVFTDDGTATLTGCTLSGNAANGYAGNYPSGIGGGIACDSNTSLDQCTLSKNAATEGGAVGCLAPYFSYYSTTTVLPALCTISGCTISANKAKQNGGGIFVATGNNLSLVNSTITGNTGVHGGGAYLALSGTFTASDSTIAGNNAVNGSGIFAKESASYSPALTLDNTIVAGNNSYSHDGDISGVVSPNSANNLIGSGFALIGIGNGANGNLIGTKAATINPLLDPLGFYGGPTETMPPMPGSPAIDAGSNAAIPAGVTTDQRGLPRILNGTVDIGAVETPADTLPAPTGLAPGGLVPAAPGYDTPTFTWNADASADHYGLTVIDNNTGALLITAADITGTSYATSFAQALMPGHSYTIYLSAFNADSSAVGVATQAFTLSNLPPPANFAPAGQVAASAGYDTPTFTWTGAGNHYTLKVIDNTTNAVAISVANISGTSYAATQALTPGHHYTMYVYAYSANGLVETSAHQTFTLAPLPAPTPIAPIGSIAASPASFNWTAVAAANHYYLYVIDDTTGAVAIQNRNIAATSFTPTVPLKIGHRYTWRVQAVSTNGLVGTWSVNETFTIS